MAGVSDFLDDSDSDIEHGQDTVPETKSQESDITVDSDDVSLVDGKDDAEYEEEEDDAMKDVSEITESSKSPTQSNDNEKLKDALNSSDQMQGEMLLNLGQNLAESKRKHLPTTEAANEQTLAYDLGNVLCYDPTDVDIDEVFKHKKPFSDPSFDQRKKAPRLTQSEWEIRNLKEKALFTMTRSNMQALSNKLFSLSRMKQGPDDDPGIIVNLPNRRTRLPRSKPLPTPRPMTTWEKFAARRGIQTKKSSGNNMEWDEMTQSWKRPWGYKKANNPMDNPIYEHKSNDFDPQDPWSKMQQQKKKRLAQIEVNRKANLEAAYGDRLAGTLDLQSAMNHSRNAKRRHIGNRFMKYQDKRKQKGHLNVALKVAQHSTASMGKFDRLNKNEPRPKLKQNRKKSVDYMQTNENTKVHQHRFGKDSYGKKERTNQTEILFNLFGKKQKEAFNVNKAVRHAQYEITKVKKIKSRSIKKRNRGKK